MRALQGQESDLKASEIDLKTSLAKYLAIHNREQTPILATEVKYGFSDRRADFVMINDFSHAFEIKSDYDSTYRLLEQISEYSYTFDFVTVVTTPLHLEKIKALIGKKIGIMVYKNGVIYEAKYAKQNLRLSKIHLASSITKERLALRIGGINKNISLFEIKEQAIKKLKTPELRKLFLEELSNRFFASSELFLKETDNEINAEDLLLLKRVTRLSF